MFLVLCVCLIGLCDLLVWAYEINSVSEFKMSGSSRLARLAQGQSDESTFLTGCLLTSPGRRPDRKHHQDCEAELFEIYLIICATLPIRVGFDFL